MIVKQLWNLNAFAPLFIADVEVPTGVEAEADMAGRVMLFVACMNVREAVSW